LKTEESETGILKDGTTKEYGPKAAIAKGV
jgi:hypothetical protein